MHDCVSYHNFAIKLSTGCTSYAHHSIKGTLFVHRMNARSIVFVGRSRLPVDKRQGPSSSKFENLQDEGHFSASISDAAHS